MKERALNYPYEAPAGSFLISGGYCRDLPDSYGFDDRVGVLSVGSNRAPAQLYRKFGEDADIPVTAVNIHGCDIVHVANLAPYGAVPCSAFPCDGVVAPLNIAWLTKSQLAIMHETEFLGVAYEFVEWDCRQVEHLHPKEVDSYLDMPALQVRLDMAQKSLLRFRPSKARTGSLQRSARQRRFLIYLPAMQAISHSLICGLKDASKIANSEMMWLTSWRTVR